MKKTINALFIIILFSCHHLSAQSDAHADPAPLTLLPDSSGLTLPAGFQARIIADNLGKARHLAVGPQGNIYVKIDRPKEGNAIVVLHENARTGKAEKITSFGNYKGTGIYIKGEHLYTSSNEAVFRYALDEKGNILQPGKPETIVAGLISRRQHESKSITLDNSGNLYVNIGAYSNACQEKDRTNGSKGMSPCPILILREASGSSRQIS